MRLILLLLTILLSGCMDRPVKIASFTAEDTGGVSRTYWAVWRNGKKPEWISVRARCGDVMTFYRRGPRYVYYQSNGLECASLIVDISPKNHKHPFGDQWIEVRGLENRGCPFMPEERLPKPGMYIFSPSMETFVPPDLNCPSYPE